MTTPVKVNKGKLRREQKEADKQAKKTNVVVQEVQVSPLEKSNIDYILKFTPHQALEKFENGKAHPDDWRTLQFRTILGHEILKAVLNTYDVADEDAATVEQLRDQSVMSIATIGAIALRYNESKQLRASPMEMEMVRGGLLVADDLQDQLSEGDTLIAYRQAERVINGKFK